MGMKMGDGMEMEMAAAMAMARTVASVTAKVNVLPF